MNAQTYLFLPREGEGDRIAGVSEANEAIWWRGWQDSVAQSAPILEG